MPFSEAGLNIALDAIAAEATSIRTHTGDPGAAGTANAGTGSAQTPTWSAASGSEVTLASNLTFDDLGADEVVSHFSLWGDTNTTFLGSGSISTGDTAANAAGEFTLTTGTTLDID